MLNVVITTVTGNSRRFLYEVDQFMWMTRNRDATSFSASFPQVVATLKILSTDDFFSQVTRGASIQVASDQPGLVITLSVIETTVFKTKGYVEIGCTADFFEQSNDLWGTIEVPEDSWFNTTSKYDLQLVQIDEARNDAFVAHVFDKTDLVLATAWSYPNVKAISPTPFTAPSGSFNTNGVGLFTPQRPGEILSPTAPVYLVYPEDIIDYNIEPAQPPITHLSGMSIGQPQMTPSVAPIPVSTIGTRLDMSTVVRSFLIKEKGLGATIVVNYGSTSARKIIVWSDGVETIIEGAIEDIIGITPMGYIRVVDSIQVQLVDRNTLEVLSSYNTGYDLASLYSVSEKHPLITSHYVKGAPGYTVVWFEKSLRLNTTTSIGFVGLVIRDDTNEMRGMFVSSSSAFQGDMFYAGSVKAYYSVTNPAPCVVALFYRTETVGAQQRVTLAVAYTMLSSSGAMPYPNILTTTNYTVQVHDFTSNFVIASSSSRARYIVSVRDSTQVSGRIYSYNGVSSSITGSLPAADKYYYVTPSEPSAYDAAAVLLISGDSWMLMASIPVSQQMRLLQEGSLRDWVGDLSDVELDYRPGMSALLYKATSQTGVVYMQMAPVPFLSRTPSRQLTPQQIADGPQNVMTLNFKAGMIPQVDSMDWDVDKGRIEVDLAAFRYRSSTSPIDFTEVSVQTLPIMALGAYVAIILDPNDEVSTLVKVTGYTLTYNGKVKARLSGIIVE